jgi:hypothetical protein
VDHPVDAANAAWVGDRQDHPGTETDLLQGEMGGHVSDRPALAQRGLPPFLVRQLFEQVGRASPLQVDHGPHFVVVHDSSVGVS